MDWCDPPSWHALLHALEARGVVVALQEASAAPALTGEPGVAAPVTRINPTKRELRFIVPVSDGEAYLGDVELAGQIGPR